MTEQLFQFIWLNGYYNPKELATIEGQRVEVIHPGSWNFDQGPDFLNARVKLDEVLWVGSVELHLKTSDWFAHGHTGDEHYKNVVLHVVYEHDRDHHLPVLELKHRISSSLMRRYEQLMKSVDFVPCAKQLNKTTEVLWCAWSERLMIERLERRRIIIESMLTESHRNWIHVFWWLLARQFGMKVNGEAFEAMARSIPFSLLMRLRGDASQVEALLFGQAGLLKGSMSDAYFQQLQERYEFLCLKHGLRPAAAVLRFSRMRPANFPTVRLAQLAALVAAEPLLFQQVLELENLEDVISKLACRPHAYWDVHFSPGRIVKAEPKNAGRDMQDLIIANVLIPLIYAYGLERKNALLMERALSWLQQLTAEDNRIVRLFQGVGLRVRSVLDSQACLELKSNYCDHHRCLDCAIGNHLLGRRSHDPAALLVMMVGGLGRSDGTGTGTEKENNGCESQKLS